MGDIPRTNRGQKLQKKEMLKTLTSTASTALSATELNAIKWKVTNTGTEILYVNMGEDASSTQYLEASLTTSSPSLTVGAEGSDGINFAHYDLSDVYVAAASTATSPTLRVDYTKITS